MTRLVEILERIQLDNLSSGTLAYGSDGDTLADNKPDSKFRTTRSETIFLRGYRPLPNYEIPITQSVIF